MRSVQPFGRSVQPFRRSRTAVSDQLHLDVVIGRRAHPRPRAGSLAWTGAGTSAQFWSRRGSRVRATAASAKATAVRPHAQPLSTWIGGGTAQAAASGAVRIFFTFIKHHQEDAPEPGAVAAAQLGSDHGRRAPHTDFSGTCCGHTRDGHRGGGMARRSGAPEIARQQHSPRPNPP